MKEKNKSESNKTVDVTHSIFNKIKLNKKVIIIAIIIIAIILIGIILLRRSNTNKIGALKYAEGETELISIKIDINATNNESYKCLLTFTSNDQNEKIKAIEYPKEEGKEPQIITVADIGGKEKVGIDYEFKIDDIDKIFKVTTTNGETKDIKTAYKLEYNLNGGEAEISEQYGLIGNSVIIPNITPSNEEKVFLGWSQEKDAETQEYNRGSSYIGRNEVETLYAVWEEGKGIVGYIAKDEINESGEYSIKRSGIIYNFDVLYIDQNNIEEYGSYENSTNTYTIENNINLGTANQSKMAVLKCNGNLVINSGVTITTSTYSVTSSSGVTGDVTKIKGMFIYCSGELINNGTITQTARGTYNTAGENIYLWSEKGEYKPFTVPAIGSEGGAGIGGRWPVILLMVNQVMMVLTEEQVEEAQEHVKE